MEEWWREGSEQDKDGAPEWTDGADVIEGGRDEEIAHDWQHYNP